jgi:hypothetical protein
VGGGGAIEGAANRSPGEPTAAEVVRKLWFALLRGSLHCISPIVAVLTTSATVTPALAGKKDNSIRFATERVVQNVDNYFNQDQVGAIFADQVWDTLIYFDPRTGDYKGQLASWSTCRGSSASRCC